MSTQSLTVRKRALDHALRRLKQWVVARLDRWRSPTRLVVDDHNHRRDAVSVRLFALSLLLFITSCNGPLPFMSGGRLDGEVQPVPQGWAFAEDFAVVQLETRPEAPYSVNVAYTLMGGRLYINAGDTETQWVKNMDANPLVRLRVSGLLYDLRAERVTDATEIAEFGKAWTSRSMLHRDPAKLDEVWIYRLVAR